MAELSCARCRGTGWKLPIGPDGAKRCNCVSDAVESEPRAPKRQRRLNRPDGKAAAGGDDV
jgi:hypothetical protein